MFTHVNVFQQSQGGSMEIRTWDVPSTQVSLGQKEKMKKNGNWDY